mgnify:CR=1 FL=1
MLLDMVKAGNLRVSVVEGRLYITSRGMGDEWHLNALIRCLERPEN